MRGAVRTPQPLTMRMLEEGRSGRVARVELSGENVYRLSLENARHISEKVRRRNYVGLAMDWRDCVMTHNVRELVDVANAFSHHLPVHVRFAVIHRAEQLAYAIQMTRSLLKTGRLARAFSVEAGALEWLDHTDDMREHAP
jgi:hypothetical protein